MKFTVNTTPLVEALDLGVINSNVSAFHKKSTLIQVSATEDTLTLNVEADSIKSEMILKGHGEGEPAKIFVGSVVMKQLIGTIDSPEITFEFDEGGLIVVAGTSKFILPKLIDEADIELDRPTVPDDFTSDIDIDKSVWKFIKDYQMYALSMSFIHPVYTYVWIGEGSDVLVGDFDNSLFTHSLVSNLDTSCLLTDSIVNLLDSFPENTKISKVGRDYVAKVKADSYEYITQFSPKYEDDEGVGSYNSDIFLNMMAHEDDGISIDTTMVNKFMNQASILASVNDDKIKMSVDADNKMLTLKDNNIDCKLAIADMPDTIDSFDIEFRSESLKKVLSNYADDYVTIYPVIQDDEVVGILVWNDALTTIIAGVYE